VASVFGGVANNRLVLAREGGIQGRRIASIDGASIIVVAKVHRDGCEDTSHGDVTSIISTSITVIASRNRTPSTMCGKRIIWIIEQTVVNGTTIAIVALR